MLRKLLAAAALLPALMGCGQLEAGSLRVDPVGELDAHVREAARRIEAATGVVVKVSTGEADLRVAALLVPEETLLPDTADVPEGAGSWSGHFDGKRILINESLPEDLRGRTVLHETLHALLLSDEHLEEEGHVLSDIAGGCLTAGDLDFVCARVGCELFVPEC